MAAQGNETVTCASWNQVCPFANSSNSFTMVCPPVRDVNQRAYTIVCPSVRGDNPRALASGSSLVQADKPWYNCFISPLLV